MTLHATRDVDNARADTVDVHVTYGPVTVKVEEHTGHARAFAYELMRLVDTPEDRARRGYTRYVKDCSGVSVHGEKLPAWEDQDEKVSAHWIAAFTE